MLAVIEGPAESFKSQHHLWMPKGINIFSYILYGEFSYLRQENSTERGVPTFSVWYHTWLSGTVAWLSGTGCLALRFVLLFIYVSN